MITKTVNLDSAYDSLFEEIKAKSNGEIDIKNIEGFFGNIEEIKEIDEKFLRLPLDEPMFEIDANTRKIEVPTDFRANGISVQGDHLAETVFFVIDRYFDWTDLSADTNIYINWKMGQESGRTKHFILNTELLPGYIVFGWPIDKIVTAKGGSLQFAVEFNKKENDNIIYRFNTLPANVNIKDGLNVSDDLEAVDLSYAIKHALTNSSFGEGDAAVGEVTWLTGEGHGLVAGNALTGPGGVILSFNPDSWQEFLNLATDVDNQGNPFSISTNLVAQAYVDNQTMIRYTDQDGEQVDAAMVKVDEVRVPVSDRANLDDNKVYYIGNGPDAAVATAEQKADESIALYEVAPLNQDLIYYIQESEEDGAYSKASDEDLAKWGTSEAVELFAKIAAMTVEGAGAYIIKAQGEKWISVKDDNDISVDKKIGAGAVKRSDVVTVPAAEGPSSIAIVEAGDVDGFDPAADSHYSVDESYENVIFIPEDGRDIKAVAEFDNFGAAKYVWQKGTQDNGKWNFVNLSEEDPQFKLEESDVLEAADEGFYRVVVTNFINNTMSDPTPSEVFILSKLAAPIVSAERQYYARNSASWLNVNTRVPCNGNFGVGVRVENVVCAESDNIFNGSLEYEWYKALIDLDNSTVEQIADPANWELVVSNANNPAEIVLNTEGWYKPVVKNVYNGSVYKFELEPFVVDITN